MGVLLFNEAVLRLARASVALPARAGAFAVVDVDYGDADHPMSTRGVKRTGGSDADYVVRRARFLMPEHETALTTLWSMVTRGLNDGVVVRECNTDVVIGPQQRIRLTMVLNPAARVPSVQLSTSNGTTVVPGVMGFDDGGRAMRILSVQVFVQENVLAPYDDRGEVWIGAYVGYPVRDQYTIQEMRQAMNGIIEAYRKHFAQAAGSDGDPRSRQRALTMNRML